jgi:hypothetical protein
MGLKEIQIIDKQTFCLEAIKSFSATNDPNLMGIINVVASEILKELAPEIESVKNKAMEAAGYRDYIGGHVSTLSQALLDHIEDVRVDGSDKYKPGDVVGGY